MKTIENYKFSLSHYWIVNAPKKNVGNRIYCLQCIWNTNCILWPNSNSQRQTDTAFYSFIVTKWNLKPTNSSSERLNRWKLCWITMCLKRNAAVDGIWILYLFQFKRLISSSIKSSIYSIGIRPSFYQKCNDHSPFWWKMGNSKKIWINLDGATWYMKKYEWIIRV